MTQYLCNIKMATTNALTKKYNVPFFSYVLQDKTVNKYLNRAARFKSLTLTQYIRWKIVWYPFLTFLNISLLFENTVFYFSIANSMAIVFMLHMWRCFEKRFCIIIPISCHAKVARLHIYVYMYNQYIIYMLFYKFCYLCYAYIWKKSYLCNLIDVFSI